MYSYSSRSAESEEQDMPETATELLERPATELPEVSEVSEDSEITAAEPAEVVAADLLVEEISIDGMCGVY
jgi:mycofactocin precursor